MVGSERARRTVAGVLWSSWIGLLLALDDRGRFFASAFGVGLLATLAAPGLLVQWRSPIAQLLARAMMWLAVCVSTVLCITRTSHVLDPGQLLVAWCGVVAAGSLLVLGRSGLDAAEGQTFVPRAFRLTLTVSIILAVADALLFLAPSVAYLVFERWSAAPGTGAVLAITNGMVLLAGAFLMYRLRTVGVLLSLLGNAGMLAWLVALVGSALLAGSSPSVLVPLLVLANVGLQVALQVPLLVAIRRGPGHAVQTERTAQAGLALVLVGMVAVCALSVWFPLYPWLRAAGLT